MAQPPELSPFDLYAALHAEAERREVASAESFDKAVLTLSTAGLGLSIAFVKDFVPLSAMVLPYVLYIAWGLFLTAAVGTILSFLTSQKAQQRQKELARLAYLESDAAAFDAPNVWAQRTDRLGLICGGAFILALLLTTVFAIANIQEVRMTARTPTETKGAPVPSLQRPASAPTAAPSQSPAPAPAPAPPQGR